MENTKLYKKNQEYVDSYNKHVSEVIGNYYKMGISYAYASILNGIQQYSFTSSDIATLIYSMMKEDADIRDCVYEVMKDMI